MRVPGAATARAAAPISAVIDAVVLGLMSRMCMGRSLPRDGRFVYKREQVARP